MLVASNRASGQAKLTLLVLATNTDAKRSAASSCVHVQPIAIHADQRCSHWYADIRAPRNAAEHTIRSAKPEVQQGAGQIRTDKKFRSASTTSTVEVASRQAPLDLKHNNLFWNLSPSRSSPALPKSRTTWMGLKHLDLKLESRIVK